MTDLLEVEAIIRGVAIGGFAASGLVLAATPRPSPTRWLGAAFFLGVIAHVISAWGPELKRFDPVWAASVVGAGLFWMFALDLLEDRPRPPSWRFAAPAAAFLFWLAAQVAPKAWCETIWGGYIAMQMMMVTHILVVAWQGWRGDLVAQRRWLRPILAASACIYVLEVAARDMGWLNALPRASVDVAQAALLAVLALGTTLVLLRAEPQLVAAQSQTPARPTAPQPLDLTPADRLILARLDKAMNENEVWRGEDLSIGGLAALVGAPEHRLRKLINGTLGHRNFADYVNGRRVEAAKVALADPEQALKPVSTIAYEHGFGSLGPFNRAFRAAFGVTPTAWRQQATPPIAHLRLVETAQAAPKSDKRA